VHKNSIKTYEEEEANLSKRERGIFNFLRMTRKPYTDRQLAQAMGFSHRSEVQPRCSDLVRKGLVKECGSIKCPETGKTVRIIRFKNNDPQEELF
jgi:hypothetical protein